MPVRRNDVLSRRRLTDFLREQIDRHLFLLVAPAAYGKTTCLVDFVNQEQVPTCYYRLDAADQDLRTFLTYLVAALQRRFAGMGERTRLAIEQSTELAQELPAVIGTLVGEIDEHVDQLAMLILDDYHTVNESKEIGQAVDLLLLYLPHQLRVAIASRKIPRISLSRLVVQQDVVGISAKHLRFTGDEVAEFVRTSYGLSLTGHAAEVLTNAVQGWVAAIVLAMHGKASMANLPFSGGHPDEAEARVFDYLAEQVLAEEDAGMRDFLLGSSVLEILTPADCDRLFGRSDSATLLAQLDDVGLFLDRLDAESPTYLFHDLFRRFLLDRLQREAPARWRSLHGTAGDLARERGDWLDAADHLLLAGRIEPAAALIEAEGDAMFEGGAARALDAILSRFPADVTPERPRLLRLWARVLNEAEDLPRAETLYRQAHEQFTRQGEPTEAARTLARLAAAQRMRGLPNEALATAASALAAAPAEERGLQAELHAQIGIAHGMLGDLEHAITVFERGVAEAQAADDRFRLAYIYRNLFMAHLRLGNLGAAEQALLVSIEYWRQLGNAARLADARANLIEIHYARGHYAPGETLAREVIAEAEALGRLTIQASAWLGLADILRDTGRLDEAASAYRQGVDLAQHAQSAFLTIYGLGRLGLTSALLGELRQGESSARLAWQQAQQRGIAYEIAVAECELGAVLLHAGEPEQALELLQRAAASFLKHGHRREAALAQLRVVRAAYDTGRFRLSTTNLRRVAEVAPTLDDDSYLVAELARGRGFLKYMLGRKVAAGWLVGAAARLPEAPAAVSVVETAAPVPVPDHRLEVRALGTAEVRLDGRVLGERDWGGDKVRSLFLYLATAEHGRERAVILRELWGDLPTPNAHFAFQSMLTRLRRAIYPECITVNDSIYALDPDAEFWCDAVEFRRRIEAAAEFDAGHAQRAVLLTEAIDLYAGAFLPDLDQPWLISERGTLEGWAERALRLLANGARDTGDYPAAVRWYRRLAEMEPYDEEVRYQLMRALAASGDRLGARREYRRLRLRLRHELRVEPADRLTALYQYLSRPRAAPVPD